MTSIPEYMTQTHASCDEQFTDAEQAVADGRWDEASTGFAAFVAACERHFAREEQVLFPQIERFTGQGGGPTQVMRMEHVQIRELMNQLERAVATDDEEEYLGFSETLLVMMQQHNMKEEQILYPMADQATDTADVLGRMRELAR